MSSMSIGDSQNEISNPQRECLSHLLRNAQTTLGNLVALIENRAAQPSASALHEGLLAVNTKLARAIEALGRGSFCALEKEECEFVGQFVGCKETR